jgi:hypothetical protein
MPVRNRYIAPIDAIKHLDSSIDDADIGDNFSIEASKETIRRFIEDVEADFEDRADDFVPTTVTEELHEGIDRDHGLTVYLDHRNLMSFDTNQGDKVELRTGQDSWTDVSDNVFVDETDGVIEIDRNHLRTTGYSYPDQTGYRIRATYRYGTGSDRSGETSLDGAIGTGDPDITVDVDDASKISEGAMILINGSEYFFVESRNTAQDQLTLSGRGLRGTQIQSHSPGDIVRYVPLDVARGISAKVAAILIQQDHFIDTLMEGGEDTSIDNSKVYDDLTDEYEQMIARYSSSNAGYV